MVVGEVALDEDAGNVVERVLATDINMIRRCIADSKAHSHDLADVGRIVNRTPKF